MKRYRAILERDPAQSFALERLFQLYRERDGNIDRLVEELTGQARQAEAYAPRILLGRIYMSRSDYEKAKRVLAEAQALRPRAPQPHVALGDVAKAQGSLEQALASYQRALERTREKEARRELMRTVAEASLDAQNFESARDYYNRMIADARDSVFLQTEYARALMERNHTERAIKEYRRLLRSLRGDRRVLGPVYRDLGRAHMQAEQYDEAIVALERGIKMGRRASAASREIQELLVQAYRGADRLSEFVERLNKRAKKGAEYQRLLGRIYDELGREDEAAQAYRRALGANRRDTETRLKLIQLLSRSGRIDDVVAEYRTLVQVAPREPRFVIELARLLVQVGRKNEALSLAERTSRAHPRDPGVHRALSELYGEWGDQERATRELAILVRIQPSDPAHLVSLGTQQLEEGRRDAALATWKKILQVSKDKGSAHAMVAGVFADHDMIEEAEAHYRKAVALRPKRIEFVRGLAGLLERSRRGEPHRVRRKRDSEAAALWQKVLALAPADRGARREARMRIIGIWARGGQLLNKMEAWARAFRGRPPDIEAGRFLAEAHLRQRPRNEAAAETVLTRVVSLKPGDVGSLLSLERVRASRGDLAGSIEVLEKLVKADARRAARYLQRMAERAHALYRDEDAVTYAARAVKHTPHDAEGHRRLADLYRARQDMDRAVASYKEAIRLNDRMFAAFFDLAELYLSRGEADEADRLYRHVIKVSPDDELVARAGRASLQIHLGAGTLEALERDLLPQALAQPGRVIFRKLVVELYGALTEPWIQGARQVGPAAEAARKKLRRVGSRAIKPLLEALADKDPSQHRAALRMLGHLENRNAAAPLLAAAEADGDLDYRTRALVASGALAGASLVPRFAALAERGERRLRGVATWSIARIGGSSAIQTLRRLISHRDANVRGYAALGFGASKDGGSGEALQRMVLRDRSPHVRACAAWALGTGGYRERAPALRRALVADQGDVSRLSAYALGALDDTDAVEILVEAMFDSQLPQRKAAAAAVSQLVSRRSSSSADLRQAHEKLPVPTGNFGLSGYVSQLLARSEVVRGSDIQFSSLRNPITRAASDALRGPRERVLTALEVLRGEGDLAVGIRPLTDGIETWPRPAQDRARTELGYVARELISDFEHATKHPDVAIRSGAVRALAQMDASPARSVLAAAMRDSEPEVQRAALQVVGNQASKETVQVIVNIAESHAQWSMRRAAVAALGRIATGRAPEANATELGATEAVIRVLRNDSFAFVRQAAVVALRSIGGAAAVAPLRYARTEDPEPRVRDAARRALREILNRD